MVEFKLETNKSEKLAKAMANVADQSEVLVNKVLKLKGTKEMIQSIIGFMPVSNKKGSHAKFSNPLTFRMLNLGFIITTKGGAANRPGSFGYLVFPNEGRGPHNLIAQEFFEKGAESASDQILDDVILALEDAHKNLGGN